MDHSNYTRNICPVSEHDKFPNHAWTGRVPDVSHLRAFGQVYPNPNPNVTSNDIKNKLEPLATSAIFVGYAEQTRIYRCLDNLTYGL